jgi:hypothetical protein
MPPSRRVRVAALGRDGSLLVATGALVRQACAVGLLSATIAITHGPDAPWVATVGWTLAASVLLGASTLAWRVSAPGVRRAAAVVTALALLAGWFGLTTWYRAHVFSSGWTSDRVPGQFPYAGGSRVEEPVGRGWRTVANILPDGTRDCGSGASGPTVLLVGDSFVFGKGLPDEDTLCWQLREAMDASGRPARWVNLGQSGASLRSVIDTLAWGLGVWKPDLIIATVLPGDDVRPFDLNDERAVMQNAVFQWVASALEPHATYLAMSLMFEVFPPEFYTIAASHALMVAFLETVTTTERPVLVSRIGCDSPTNTAMYDRQIADIDARSTWIDAAPSFDLNALPPTDVWVIPDDGHTTRAGNAVWAEQLRPWLEAHIPQAEAP